MASTSLVEATRRLFVGRLPPYAKGADLLKAFKKDGAKKAHVIRKGEMRIGFVSFDTTEEANAALARVAEQGLFLYKRRLVVRKADPWHERGGVPKDPERSRPSVTDEPVSLAQALPEEVIAYIASFLPYRDCARMERVCRLWRRGSMRSHGDTEVLSSDSNLWSYGWEKLPMTTEGFYWLLKRAGPTIKEIYLSDEGYDQELRPYALTIAAKACSELRVVDLRNTIARPSGLRNLGESTTSLTTLILGKSWGAVDRELETVFQRNLSLTTVRMYNFRFPGLALASLTPEVKHLTFERCAQLRSDCLAGYLETAVALEALDLISMRSLQGVQLLRVLSTCKALGETMTSLAIHDTSFTTQWEEDEKEEEATEEMEPPRDEEPNFFELAWGPVDSAQDIPGNLVRLTSLQLTAVGWVDSVFVASVGHHLRSLETLNLSLSSNIRGDEALESLAEIQTLRILKVNNMHPSVGFHFLSGMAALEYVEARDNDGMDTESICGLLRNVPLLSHLDLESCTRLEHPVLKAAIEVTREIGRTGRLDLYLGGTNVRKHRKDRLHMRLGVHFGRLSQRAV